MMRMGMGWRKGLMMMMMTLIVGSVLPIILGVSVNAGKLSDNSGFAGQMVEIPSGPFFEGMKVEQLSSFGREFMIDPGELVIQPYREIDLPRFFVDRYEVTNRQYQSFVQKTGHRLPLVWLDRGYPTGADNLPVTGIDFHDAKAFCQSAGKRLPTEQEWEKAARGPDGRLWPWGNKWDRTASKMDLADGNPLSPLPARVGAYPRDRSVYGVMDMAGNVSEWVETRIQGSLADIALTKGGNFALAEPYSFLSAGRTGQPQGNALDYLGFRCAASENVALSENLGDTPSFEPTPAASPALNTRAGSPSYYRKPDLSLYRSHSIQILPVTNLDPDGIYHNNMETYMPRQTTEPQNAEKMLPWKLEIKVPYFPDDRFAVLFEQYWNMRPRILSSHFNADNTSFELRAIKPDEMQINLTVRGGLDFIDLDYVLKNIGHTVIPRATETCFQSLSAPNFRDHEGTRTMVMTAGGFKPMTQLRGQANLRRLIFQLEPDTGGISTSADEVSGPLIALVSRDHQWLVSTVSMSGPAVRLVNNCEYSCIHANPPSRIQVGETIKVRERIYFLHGSLDDLVARRKADLGRGGES
jgi:formylglycine-generating enzyme required for sulfatase activity